MALSFPATVAGGREDNAYGAAIEPSQRGKFVPCRMMEDERRGQSGDITLG
jgi:hypothetical protein